MPDGFIAGAFSGVMVSSGGAAWSVVSTGLTAVRWHMAVNNDVSLLTDADEYGVSTTNASGSWPNLLLPESDLGMGDGCWADALGVFCGYSRSANNRTATYEPATDSWTLGAEIVHPNWAGVIQGIAWSPTREVFVLCGFNGLIAVSPDGLNWTITKEPLAVFANANHLFEVVWDNVHQRFVVFGVRSTDVGTVRPGSYISSDGAAWTESIIVPQIAGNMSYTAAEVDQVNGWIVMADAQGYVYTSDDGGDSWASRGRPTIDSSSPGGASSIAYSHALERWVLATDDRLWTSDDGGVTWTERTNPGGIIYRVLPADIFIAEIDNGPWTGFIGA